MIVDRLEDWQRAGCPTTPERVAWAEAYVAEMAVSSLRKNFMPALEGQHEDRPEATLSTKTYCARQLALTLQGAEKEPMEPSASWKFDIGNATETTVCATMILAGLPVLSPIPGTARQVRLTAPRGGRMLRASIDTILAADLMDKPVASVAELLAYYDRRGPVIVADEKSTHPYGFREAIRVMDAATAQKRNEWPDQAPMVPGTRRVGNSFGYEDQVLNYDYALEYNGFRVVGRFLIPMDKSSGEMAEIEVPAWPDQRKIAEAAYAAADAGLPERPAWATLRVVNSPGGRVEQIEATRCSYCAVKAACMPGMERKIISGEVVYRRPVEAKS